MMTLNKPSDRKRAYVAPTLKEYGDMTTLTKNQSGSLPESTGNRGITSNDMA